MARVILIGGASGTGKTRLSYPLAQRLGLSVAVETHLAASRALLPALEAVVLNHIQEGPPVVLEGDHLLPELVARPALVRSGPSSCTSRTRRSWSATCGHVNRKKESSAAGRT